MARARRQSGEIGASPATPEAPRTMSSPEPLTDEERATLVREQARPDGVVTGRLAEKVMAQENAKVTPKAGRPSKLETRAWEHYSRNVTVAMSRDHRQDRFLEAMMLAAEFEEFWQASK